MDGSATVDDGDLAVGDRVRVTTAAGASWWGVVEQLLPIPRDCPSHPGFRAKYGVADGDGRVGVFCRPQLTPARGV